MSEPGGEADARADYDSPWKDALEHFFREMIQFMLPAVYADIDWDRGVVFLDKELQKIRPDAETGRLFVDKLAQVWRKSGEPAAVYAHIEVQGQRQAEFPERVYLYNCTLHLKFRMPVFSLAILTDDNPNWKPDRYSYEIWGCEPGITYPVIKLLDYQDRWDELEASDNPFALIVMAHLKALATRGDIESRFAWRIRLVRLLSGKGYGRDDIYYLLRFMDWIMTLPTDLESKVEEEIEQLEGAQKMPHLMGFERRAVARTAREDVLDILEFRFHEAPTEIADRLQELEDRDVLKSLHRMALTAQTLDEFRQALP